MKFNNFQPINFIEGLTSCSCTSTDSQPVQDGDVTQFQVELEVCNLNVNLITNGDFDDATGTGWTNDGFAFVTNNVIATGASKSTLMSSEWIFGADLFYQAEINITACFGAPLYIYFGKNKVIEIKKEGFYIVSGKCLSDIDIEHFKIVSPFGNSCTIERVACYPLESNFAIALMDIDNNVLYVRDLADDAADVGNEMFRLDRNTITVSWDWTYIMGVLARSYGCYKLGIMGLCQNTCGQLGLTDPTFTVPNLTPSEFTHPWEYTPGGVAPKTFYINYGLLVYGGSNAGFATGILLDSEAASCDAPPGGSRADFLYEVTLIIDSIADVEVSVEFGGDSSPVYTTAGTKVFNITTINSQPFFILIQDTLAGTQGSCVISFINYTQKTTAAYSPDYSSNVFDYKAEHPCTLLVAATNNEDAYGLNFEGAMYVPRARFKGTLRADNPDTEVESSIDSFGNKIINYFEARILKSLRLQNVPDYLTQWLTLFNGFNNLYVDQVEYVADDDINVKYNRFCDLAKIDLTVGAKRQKLINTNKKGTFAVSNYYNYLVRTFDEQEAVILIDGDDIQLNG